MEKVKVINRENTFLNQILAELRDENVQKDRSKFRNNLERAGELVAYEMSKTFNYSEKEVLTQLGSANMKLPDEDMVICSILRAAVPFHNGFLRLFDQADCGFVSAYRHHTDDNEFEIRVEYLSVPHLSGRTLVLVDPMIATGRSIVVSYEALTEESGIPQKVLIGSVIASEEGLEYVRKHIPRAEIFLIAMDKELTARSYIVPGLGDAGDLAYGSKE